MQLLGHPDPSWGLFILPRPLPAQKLNLCAGSAAFRLVTQWEGHLFPGLLSGKNTCPGLTSSGVLCSPLRWGALCCPQPRPPPPRPLSLCSLLLARIQAVPTPQPGLPLPSQLCPCPRSKSRLLPLELLPGALAVLLGKCLPASLMTPGVSLCGRDREIGANLPVCCLRTTPCSQDSLTL